MEHNNDQSNKQTTDPVIAEMQKMNFSLADIASSLSFFKWLTIISLIISVLLAVVIVPFLPQLAK